MDNNCIINITPETSKVDESINIKISGLSKNEKVTIRAVSNDYYCINVSIFEVGNKAEWESYATFAADECGNIDLENAKPIEGTYKECDPMGLFYSMSVKQNPKRSIPQKLSDIGENRKYTITFTVERNGEIITSKKHTRVYCDETIQSRDIKDKDFVARYFTSKNIMKRPAIIVVSGSDGRIEKAQAIAEIFAMKGYSALAICYFGLEGTKKELNCISLECIENAIEWLKKQDTVDNNKIAIYGRSKGGEMVLLAASIFKDINCVIANTPSPYVYEGMRSNNHPSHHSTWTYKGKEIPYIKFSFRIILQLMIKMLRKEKGALSWMYKQLIRGRDTEKATIQLDRINGPILMVSSKLDAIWPSKMHCEAAAELLEKSHFKYEYKHITYEKSGHMLTLPFQSIFPSQKYPADIDSYAQANISSWNETINFLKKWAQK